MFINLFQVIMRSKENKIKLNENNSSGFSLRTNSSQKSNRDFLKNRQLHGRLYQKGWYYEKKAMEIILDKASHEKMTIFLVKSPYSYPFDILGFSQESPKTVYLFEIKFTYHDSLTIFKQKLLRAKNFVKRYHNWAFRYIVMVFWGSVLKYDFYEIDLDKTPKNIILKPKNIGENANIL